ncbi:DUF4260 domain-containing protein [Streptomyces sp. SID12488]|uniref:DUF4260 domain-containing protein n=1 Tax=Streptomyces sp. SID12488 TaxID=2706040 RepID=UPI0013DCAF26|nr:DUF4260 domain-containing protein [Streptomyces sp. SID12488]
MECLARGVRGPFWDARNLFHTRTTSRLARLEWSVALVVSSVAALTHLSEIRWWLFVSLFLVIDVIGYIPGAIAYRGSPDGRIGRRYYVAYNLMHSLVTWAVFAGVWSWLVGAEWALLALPIHLLGDRALFGNSLKPFGVPFEPSIHPDFATFQHAYDGKVRDAVRV